MKKKKKKDILRELTEARRSDAALREAEIPFETMTFDEKKASKK